MFWWSTSEILLDNRIYTRGRIELSQIVDSEEGNEETGGQNSSEICAERESKTSEHACNEVCDHVTNYLYVAIDRRRKAVNVYSCVYNLL